jgi:thiol-disulfide isomerase/thioredoxin
MKKIIVISTIFFLFFSCDSKSVNIFEIELPNETIENKKFDINDYKNKSVLLNFWFPSCPPCVYELEILNEINKELDSTSIIGVQVLGLDTQDDGVKMFQNKKILYKSIVDNGDSLVQNFEITVFPTTILFDNKGDEIKRWIGIVDKEKVKKEIASLQTNE